MKLSVRRLRPSRRFLGAAAERFAPAQLVCDPPAPAALPPAPPPTAPQYQVVLGCRCTAVGEEEAAASIRGYVLAVDFTARDEQAQAKEAGLPWAVSKSHDGFCPIRCAPGFCTDRTAPFPHPPFGAMPSLSLHTSEMLSPEDVPDVDALELSLDVNGERRQTGSPRDMVHRIPKLLSHIRWSSPPAPSPFPSPLSAPWAPSAPALCRGSGVEAPAHPSRRPSARSHVMTLQENDLVLTGTPEGVGPVKLGDVRGRGAASHMRFNPVTTSSLPRPLPRAAQRVSCVLRDETKSGNLTTLAFTVE